MFDHVPLSCVPPITSQDWAGLIATLMNWIVLLNRRLMWSSWAGTRESIRLHAMLSPPTTVPSAVVPFRPTSSHCDEVSANVPLVRTRPPSDPSKNWVGLPGLITITCWSGWMAFGALRQNVSPYGANAHHGAAVSCASNVLSVNVLMPLAASGSPAVSE
jgi:hypothetical protein